jgi:hypothetical protein
MLNYTNLMAREPFQYGKMMNDKGQLIEFYEHPEHGDGYPVIAVCHEMKLAACTDFYELDDMTAEHGEYQPWFSENEFHIGL